MIGERPGHLLVDVRAKRLGKVLDQVAAAGDVQHLRAAADREHRHVALERRLEQRELAVVATLLRRVGCGVRLRAVRGRVDVRPAREDDPVERGERLLDAVVARRHDERAASGSLDRVDVVERHERGGEPPRPPARLLRVGRDPDHRPAAHAASLRGPTEAAQMRSKYRLRSQSVT